MKRILIILLTHGLFVHMLNSQTLNQQIEEAYKSLDTLSCIENVKLSFRAEKEENHRKAIDTSLELILSRLKDKNIDSVQKQNIIDSLMRRYSSKSWIEEPCNEFTTEIGSGTPLYVLNLILDKHELSKKQICLQPDTSRIPFNLFYFDKRVNPKLYIFVESGYTYYSNFYFTFSKRIAKNAPKVFGRILQKKPTYLLGCYELDGMNTILYMLGNKIYVYRIAQMEEYELDDYIKKFYNSILRWNNVGSKNMNDCVPTTFAEADDYFDGNTAYGEYKTITEYQEDAGVKITRALYQKLLYEQFDAFIYNDPSALADPEVAREILNSGHLLHTHMPHNNGLFHADNLRSIRYYSNKVILRYRIGNYKLSAVDKNWWFFLLKGLK
ncbi:MAG: hypothetical protein LBL90_08165 [Prevotellaceae bacterium]|jgi:hypothetical protein|nr:hypothetical protein [Prevotellaceae bacterium]